MVINHTKRQILRTLCDVSYKTGQYDVIKYAEIPLHLLAKQHTNHYPTSDGQTRGCANILFLAKGSSTTQKNDAGRTPIMEAAMAG